MASSGSGFRDRVIQDAKEAEELAEKLLSSPASEWTVWKTVDSDDGSGHKIEVHSRSDMGNLHLTRGVMYVNSRDLSVEDVFKIALDTEARPQWDEMCEEGHVIETIAENIRVDYLSMFPIAVISRRDFVGVFAWKALPNGGMISYSKSTEHPDVPDNLKAGRVRAHLAIGCFAAEPQPDGRIKITYFGQADIKGWVPGFAINLACWKGALVIDRIRSFCMKKKQESGESK